jgi:hypothetical protein
MFDPRADHALVITAPDVSTLGIREIAIRARPLAPSIFSAGSFQWPVGEVAIPPGIDLNNIGITGSFATGQHTIYVALLVKPSNPGTSSGTEPPVMIFRALADIDSLQWRIVPSKGEPTTWNRYGRRVLAGDRIILKPDLAAGQTMTFQIGARPRNGEYEVSDFELYGL